MPAPTPSETNRKAVYYEKGVASGRNRTGASNQDTRTGPRATARLVHLHPAARPCRAWSNEATGTSASSSPLTEEMAPVTIAFVDGAVANHHHPRPDSVDQGSSCRSITEAVAHGDFLRTHSHRAEYQNRFGAGHGDTVVASMSVTVPWVEFLTRTLTSGRPPTSSVEVTVPDTTVSCA